MDLGATLCTPRSPACGICPWMRAPAPAAGSGSPPTLPRRAEKPAKPVRHGTAWLALRADGAVLVETRPPQGLLGGMLGLPGDVWTESPPPPRPPFAADWRDLGEVRHTFTHFHLILRLDGRAPPRRHAGPLRRLARPPAPSSASSPRVMRKALRLGLPALER